MDLTVEIQKNESMSFERLCQAYKTLLSGLYCREEGEALLDKAIAQSGKSSFIYRKYELVEKLRKAGANADKNMSIDELRTCVKKLPDGKEIDRKMFDILFKMYKNFVTPNQQMERIVRSLGKPKYQNCSVRLSILKQFILNTDYHTGPVTEMIRGNVHRDTGELIPRRNADKELLADHADESLFNVLKFRMTKDEKKKYTLLRLCDDLAEGKFRTNGATRHALYMFAFAFDMSFYPDNTSAGYDPGQDIEKNLFLDYYNNYLLRLLIQPENEKNSDYEAAPSGEGINYKNYGEVIYLYYLNRKDLPIRERIKRADEMIDRCRLEKEKMPEDQGFNRLSGKYDVDPYTYVYKDSFLDILKNLNEEELMNYIVSNYSCEEGKEFRSKIMVSSDTRTAVYYYRNIVSKRLPVVENRSVRMEKILSGNPGWDKGYTDLLKRLNEMLHPIIRKDKTRLTREELIAVFYDLWRATSEQDGMSLNDLFDACSAKLNPVLLDSRFQPLNVTNIFDVFMVIMLYRYLNLV